MVLDVLLLKGNTKEETKKQNNRRCKKRKEKKRSEECHKSHFTAFILTLSVMSYDSCVLMLVLPETSYWLARIVEGIFIYLVTLQTCPDADTPPFFPKIFLPSKGLTDIGKHENFVKRFRIYFSPFKFSGMWLTSGGSILYYFIIIIHNNYWHFDEKSFFPQIW